MRKKMVVVRLLFILFFIILLYYPWRKYIFVGNNGEDPLLNEANDKGEEEEKTRF